MNEPLKHTPLALLDRKSCAVEDQVPNELYGYNSFAPQKPLVNLKLKTNPAHKWYYYPDMTGNEVIAFTQKYIEKGVEQTECQTVFHTAFEDPTTPEGAEKRKSFEFRAPLLLK